MPSKKYGIPDKNSVKLWVSNYQSFGDNALIRSRKQEKYSFEKKLFAVELYLSSEISYRDLAIQEGIANPSVIINWVSRFRTAGSDALRPHRKGRKKTNPKKNIKEETAERVVDTSAEHIKELEDELIKLRIENAFLTK